MLSQQIRKRCYKTFGTNVINSPIFPSFLIFCTFYNLRENTYFLKLYFFFTYFYNVSFFTFYVSENSYLETNLVLKEELNYNQEFYSRIINDTSFIRECKLYWYLKFFYDNLLFVVLQLLGTFVNWMVQTFIQSSVNRRVCREEPYRKC